MIRGKTRQPEGDIDAGWKSYSPNFPTKTRERKTGPLHSPTLIATLRALERRLRLYPKPMNRREADDPPLICDIPHRGNVK